MAVGRMSPVRILFCLVFIVAIGYAVVTFGQPYYRYNVLKSELVQISIMTSQSVQKLRALAREAIEEQDVPVEEEDLRVIKNDYGDVAIHAEWQEDVYMFGTYATTLYFDIDVGAGVR